MAYTDVIALVCALLVPLLTLPMAIWLWRGKLPKRGGGIGYRTRRSHLSEACWEYANRTIGKWWVGGCVIGAVLSTALCLVLWPHIVTLSIVLPFVQLAVILVAPIFVVEHGLKTRFDEQGRPQ